MNATSSNKKSLYGSLAMLIAWLLAMLNVDVAAGEIEVLLGQAVEAIQVLLGIGGFALAVWGKIRGKDAGDKLADAGDSAGDAASDAWTDAKNWSDEKANDAKK